jgi:hypothetical protein
LVTGSAKDYYLALTKGMGEINTRPQWMAPESYRYLIDVNLSKYLIKVST